VSKKTPKPKPKPTDSLLKTSKKGKVELKEEDLKRVAGGVKVNTDFKVR
jgi:hypothetical protein